MVRQNTGQQAYEDPNLFAGGGINAGSEHPVKRGFWLNLLLSQPLLMLGGMWALLVLIASLAFGGLLDPGLKDPPKLSPLEQSRLSERNGSQSEKTIHPDTQPSGSPETRSTAASHPNETLNPAELNQASNLSGPSIPVWSLGALVLSCAAGCLAINHYLNAPPAPPVKTLRQPKHPKAGKPTLRSLKRLKPYTSPEVNPPNPPIGEAQRSPQPAANAHSPEAPSLSAKPVATTVVPPTENNPLDWPDGSLAHQLDLRQQKSLSSWF